MSKTNSAMRSTSTKRKTPTAKSSSVDHTTPQPTLPNETSQEHLHELFMQAPAMIVLLRGPNHVFELANPMYRKLVGECWDIMGKPVREALPHMEKKFIKLLDQVYKTGKPFVGKEMPSRMDRKANGKFETVYCNFVYQPYRDASGKVQGIFAHGVDVTEQVLARQKAEENQEYFRSSFEQTAVGMAHTGINGEWLRVNQRLCDLLGYKKSELLSKNFFDITHPADVPATLEAIQQLTTNKLPTYAFEKRYIKKDGSIVWTNLTISPLRGSDGSIKNFISVIENITKRKRAEAALRESEARFKATFNQAAIAMSIIDLGGKWINFNAAYPKMFGYSETELKKLDLVALTHPADRMEDQRAIKKLLRGKIEAIIREKRYIHKNGSAVWGMAHASLVRDEGGKPQYIVTAIQDITRRKYVEENLQISELRHRTMFEQSPLSMQILAPDGTTLQVNKAWEELWGATLEQVKNSNILKEKKLVKLGIMPSLRKGFEGKPSLIPAVEYDASHRWVRGFIYPVKDREGKVREVVLMHEDITQKKKVEEALKQSEDRFRAMFEQSTLSVQILSPDGRTLQVNKAWEELWGTSLDQLKDYNMLKDKQLVNLGIMPYIKKGFKGESALIPAVKYVPSKTIAGIDAVPYRWVQAYIYPIKDKKGIVREVVLVHEDITESKQHEDEMQKANELLMAQQKELEILNQSKDEFIALASHQLRTPATAIKQLLGLFVEGLQPDIAEHHLNILKKAYQSNERQINIVNSLLKVAQVDAGSIVLRKTDINIVELLKDVVDELKDTFYSKNQTIDFTPTSNSASVHADKQYLRMALENIVSNASKYTYKHGSVSISVSQNKKFVKISIKDSGVGIAKSDINTLYEKFKRIPNDLSDEVGGVGLGLYWTNKVIALHNGKIEVESEPNKGTTFIVYLSREQKNA